MMKLVFTLLISLVPSLAFATMPICRDAQQNALPLDNAGTLRLKDTTPNLFKKQVFVRARLVEITETKVNQYGRHLRIIVSLDESGNLARQENWIEISHSLNGYNAPTAADLKGEFYVCGEYSTTQANKHPRITKFEPSITGAMIHWTHAAGRDLNSPSTRHPHGWIYANGQIFGVFTPKAY